MAINPPLDEYAEAAAPRGGARWLQAGREFAQRQPLGTVGIEEKA